MEFSVEDYLASKGVGFKVASASEINMPCVFCNEPEDKRGRLYMSRDSDPPGLFMCHLCGERGAINKIRKYYGDAPLREEDGAADESTVGIFSAATEYYYQNLADNLDAVHYLMDERGLSLDTIEKFQLGWADGNLLKYLVGEGFEVDAIVKTGLVRKDGSDFLRNKITIPYHVQGNPVCIRGKEIGGKYLTPPGQKARLFNSDTTWKNPEFLITVEGEFDCMIMEQLGYACVGVPGANTWQDSWTAYLDGITRMYICFDPDDAGRAGAEKLATKIGNKTRIVNLPEIEPGNDISDLVTKHNQNKDDFDMLFIRARGGMLITVQEAFEEWQNIEGNPNLKGLELGFPMIDAAIAPGLLPSQVMIWLARSGTGKTLALLNVFHRIAMSQPEKKILFVSLEQTRNEWFERARRIHRFYDLDATNQDTVNLWESRFLMIDKNRVTGEQLQGCIEQYEYDMGQKPDLVAIDYLGYWAKSYKGDAYERTSAAVMDLKAIGKDCKVPIFAPHQVSRGAGQGEEFSSDNARDSGVVLETADFLFNLWAPDQRVGRNAEDRTGELNLKIDKSRHGGAGVKAVLQFAPLCLAMVPLGDPLFARAQMDNRLNMRGDTFDQAIERYRTGNMNLV